MEDYKWSTVSKKRNKLQQMITSPKTGHDSHIPEDKADALKWYNEGLPEDLENIVQKALRRSVFAPKPSQATRRPVDLAQWLYDPKQY